MSYDEQSFCCFQRIKGKIQINHFYLKLLYVCLYAGILYPVIASDVPLRTPAKKGHIQSCSNKIFSDTFWFSLDLK